MKKKKERKWKGREKGKKNKRRKQKGQTKGREPTKWGKKGEGNKKGTKKVDRSTD
jgi:hypothetical protein